MKHISELQNKTARAILAQTLPDDPYHMAILSAAGELVAAGMGDCLFFSVRPQHAGLESATIWRDAVNPYCLIKVNDYGAIS